MMQLLRTEWLKIKNYTAFLLLSIGFGVGVIATNYIVYSVNKNIVKQINTGGLVSFSPYNFDMTWQTTSYVTGWLLLLPALLILIVITNEFGYRTNRQNIIDGWSREQFINVKLVIALIATIASTVLVILTALSFGLFSGSSFSMKGFSHVGFFFLKSLTYNLIAVFIAVWIRRTGFAIGLYFIYLGAENILSQLLTVWSIKLKQQGTDTGNMGDYLPMNAADGLLTFPDNAFKAMTTSVLPTDYTWLVVAFTIVYLALFFWLSRKLFLTKDL